jgi:hypothetical protein
MVIWMIQITMISARMVSNIVPNFTLTSSQRMDGADEYIDLMRVML